MKSVLEAYSTSWQRRAFVVPIFVGVRLLSFAIIAPLTGIIGSLAIALSDQTALTDQDIARFLLTPTGFVAALVVIAVFLTGSFVGFAAMAVDVRGQDAQGLRALQLTLQKMLGGLPTLLVYAALLALRVIVVVLPFILVGLIFAMQLIGEHDINFYLSTRPPKFYITVVVVGVLLAAMVVLLINRLLGWALSLHMVLFSGSGPNEAFAKSRQRMAGHRVYLLRALLLWLVVRIGLTIGLGIVFGLLLQTIPGLFHGLRTALTIILMFAGVWALAGMIVTAVSLGALAGILDRLYTGSGATGPVANTGLGRFFSVPVVLSGSAALILFGLVTGGVMLDQIKTDDNVTVIAHRGAAGARPENTLAAVRKAIEDSADWVEIDVQETADGEVVVMHDSDFMKLAGVDLKIWDATMDELADIDIGSWFDPAYASERTPTLAEVLDIARDRAKVLVELKYYDHDVDLEARTAAIIEAADMADQIAIMSLKYPAVQKMRALRPDWRVGVLAATSIGDLTGLDGDFIAVNTVQASPRLVKATHVAGKQLYVWTVNEPLQMSSMMSMGVDGVITDEPALAREVIAVRASMSTPQRLLLLLAERFGLTLPTISYRDSSP